VLSSISLIELLPKNLQSWKKKKNVYAVSDTTNALLALVKVFET